MQDLSHLCNPDPISSLTPTSMAAGNMESSNANAMTAPGSPPVDPLPPAAEQDDPDIVASVHDRTVVTRGEDTGLHGGPQVLVRGAWNDLGGGGAPAGYRGGAR